MKTKNISEQKKSKKYGIIIGLVLAVVLGIFSITLAVLTSNLYVGSNSTQVVPWNVIWSNASVESSRGELESGVVEFASTDKENDTVIIKNLKIHNYGAHQVYAVTAKNIGSVKAKLSKFEINVDSNNDVVKNDLVVKLVEPEIFAMDPSAPKDSSGNDIVLEAGGEHKFYVEVDYKNYSFDGENNEYYTTNSLPTENVDFDIKITTEFEQVA